MATIKSSSRNDGEDDILAELDAIAVEIDRLDLVSALGKLMDLLGRRPDVAMPFLLSNVTGLKAKLEHREIARRTGKLDPAEFERDRENIAHNAKRLIAMVKAGSSGISGITATGEQGARQEGPHPAPNPFGVGPDLGAVIDARGISKIHKGTSFRLEKIDLKVMPGDILGIVGINGSGKSTLLDILRGEIAPDAGDVHYPSLSPDRQDWTRIRTQIGYLPQRSFPWNGSLRTMVEYACAIHNHYDSSNSERVDMLLTRHGLTAYQGHSWAQLSSGYRLRTNLVMARIQPPRLMILDEPLANLDPVSQQIFLEDLTQLARGEGGFKPGIVLTSQHLYELEAVATSLIVLSGGRQVKEMKDRPCSYFEIWSRDLTLGAVQKAFGILRPDLPAGTPGASANGWDIRMGRTAYEEAKEKEEILNLYGFWQQDVVNSYQLLTYSKRLPDQDKVGSKERPALKRGLNEVSVGINKDEFLVAHHISAEERKIAQVRA
jgi:ABC-type multidrug transport system ATPase subunit